MNPIVARVLLALVAVGAALAAHYVGEMELASLLLGSVPGIIAGAALLRRPGDRPPRRSSVLK